MKATIVVTTHNRPDAVHDAVDDALGQSHRDVEVIVVDDGSDPPYEPRVADPRLRVVHLQPARGVCAARNVGLREATGEWITYLDDDDRLEPHMVQLSLQAALSSALPPPVTALSSILVQTSRGDELEVYRPVTLPRGSRYHLEPLPPGRSWTTHNTFFAPVEVLREIGGWDESLRSFPHSDLFLRLNAVCSIQGFDDVTYRLVSHEGPRRTTDELAIARSVDDTTRKHWGLYRQQPARTAGMLRHSARAYLDAGHWRPAIGVAVRAVRLEPLHPHSVRVLASSLAGPRLRKVRAGLLGRDA